MFTQKHKNKKLSMKTKRKKIYKESEGIYVFFLGMCRARPSKDRGLRYKLHNYYFRMIVCEYGLVLVLYTCVIKRS